MYVSHYFLFTYIHTYMGDEGLQLLLLRLMSESKTRQQLITILNLAHA